jgi:hypothetical protein
MSKSKERPLVDDPAPAKWLGLTKEWSEKVGFDFANESDRGVALIAAAYLDQALEQLLRAHFGGGRKLADELLEQGRALSSFRSRILLAHAVGLIGPLHFQTLDAIREIRNKFAHFRRDLKFETPEVKSLIMQKFKLPYILRVPGPDLTKMRNRYIWTAGGMVNRFDFRRHRLTPCAAPENE